MSKKYNVAIIIIIIIIFIIIIIIKFIVTQHMLQKINI